MKKIIFAISFAVLFTGVAVKASAQNDMADVLDGIERNNTTLGALREQVEADKLENKSGIFLEDPEVEFNYLWGSPSGIGKRNDISVSQSFDIPAITGMRRRLADGQNNLVDLQYKADRMAILLEAKKCIIELVYYNALKKELELRVEHAHTVAGGYKSRLDSGDINILEYNKAQLNLSSAQGELSRVEIERTALLEELKRFNGGNQLVLNDIRYPEVFTAVDFDLWFGEAARKNPVLQYARKETEVSQKQVSLAKAEGLPSFSAGYMREKTLGQSYQGVAVGISIPLWQNKNKLKQADAASKAAEARQNDSRQQFYSQLRNQYERAEGFRKTAEAYRHALSESNNAALLKKALDAGQISLLDYMVEIGLYYEIVVKALEAERDYQLAAAELSAMEL